MIIDLPGTSTSDIGRKLVTLRGDVGAMALGRVLTLVVVVDSEHLDVAMTAATDASRQHPSRIIALVPESRRGNPRLDAQIRVGGDAGASEVVIVHLYGGLADHGRSVALPLLLADSPVLAWWPHLAPADVARDPIGAMAQRRVTDAGTVDLPLVGEVAAAGMTPAEFAGRLKHVLEQKILHRASVTVELVEVRSKPILVMGAVKTPGNLPFTGRWTLIEALAAAGGLGDGHADVVYILRRASNGLSDQVAVRLDDLLVKGDPRANLPIYANDLINVPGRVAIRIFCLGEVGKPGEVEFSSSDHMTVLSAIARAGGLTERASNKISIKRRRGQTLEQEIVVDYKRILAGKEPDLELKEGDVLVVKESFF
jgi:protein involved in polysaccharide export with SLBB domain